MFCSQCGTKLPEGSAFCSQCGASTKQGVPTPKAAPVAQPKPVVAKPVAAAKKSQIDMAKWASCAKKNLILITTVVSLLLILFGIINALNKPFYKVPAVSLVLMASGEGDAAVEELLDDLDDSTDELKHELDYREDFLDDDEVEAVEKVIAEMERIQDNFSVHNFRRFVNLAEDIDEEFNAGFDHDEIQEVRQIMNILVAAVWLSFILPVLFTVLSGLKKSAALTIVGIVFTALSQLTLCGILWFILSLAVGVCRVLLCKQNAAAKTLEQA